MLGVGIGPLSVGAECVFAVGSWSAGLARHGLDRTGPAARHPAKRELVVIKTVGLGAKQDYITTS